MDNSPQLWLIVVTSGASVISVLVLFIRALMTERKPTNGNGNGAKQSRECWEQHQTVLGEIRSLKQDIGMVQKTLDDRQPVFLKMHERLDDINLSVHTREDPGRRK